jgi:hypothetical protein
VADEASGAVIVKSPPERLMPARGWCRWRGFAAALKLVALADYIARNHRPIEIDALSAL